MMMTTRTRTRPRPSVDRARKEGDGFPGPFQLGRCAVCVWCGAANRRMGVGAGGKNARWRLESLGCGGLADWDPFRVGLEGEGVFFFYSGLGCEGKWTQGGGGGCCGRALREKGASL